MAEDTTRIRGAGTPHSPHGPAAEARARPAGQEAAGPAADWLRRRAEVMLLSVVASGSREAEFPQGGGCSGSSGSHGSHSSNWGCGSAAVFPVDTAHSEGDISLQFHKMSVVWLPRTGPKLHRVPSLLF